VYLAAAVAGAEALAAPPQALAGPRAPSSVGAEKRRVVVIGGGRGAPPWPRASRTSLTSHSLIGQPPGGLLMSPALAGGG